MAIFEKHGVDGEKAFQFFPLKNFSFPAHFHRAYEIIYVNEGELHVYIDQKEYLLKKQDLVFVFNNQIHEIKNIVDSDTTIILFSPELIGDFFMNYKGNNPVDNLIHLEEPLNISGKESIYSQKSLLYKLCAEMVEQKEFIHMKQSPQKKVIYQMLLYVAENYSGNLILKELASDLQYDYAYLSKLFIKQMNMTFTEYLNHYRISQACYLLKNSSSTIGEVAIQCGYQNLRTFHRNFHEITNKSPREYRVMK